MRFSILTILALLCVSTISAGSRKNRVFRVTHTNFNADWSHYLLQLVQEAYQNFGKNQWAERIDQRIRAEQNGTRMTVLWSKKDFVVAWYGSPKHFMTDNGKYYFDISI
ncbi:unnamed protein product [Caenorhabditis angaria]|uniref:Uncharacterized protein n=1 Tax=Caenorhabditis angaria TaxID=860376 RepID=A0A9P1IEC2_9PELO|nr:unnamed protein product [Caenorhabditis angaria]